VEQRSAACILLFLLLLLLLLHVESGTRARKATERECHSLKTNTLRRVISEIPCSSFILIFISTCILVLVYYWDKQLYHPI